jgi:hypothetical protein
VDFIIGVKALPYLMLPGMINLDDAIMQETRLGYTVMGQGEVVAGIQVEMDPERTDDESGEDSDSTEVNTDLNDPPTYIKSSLVKPPENAAEFRIIPTTYHEQRVMELLTEFFQEELPASERKNYPEFAYEMTVKRDGDGYIVRIPWRPNVEIGDSEAQTIARYKRMIRGMKESELKAYRDEINKSIAAGHLVEVPKGKKPRNWIANFPLFKDSLTTPVRPIYTADQKTSNGKSINDAQFSGPKLQQELPDCITRFRYGKIAVTADISKMFLQVRVDPDDALFQCTIVPTADGKGFRTMMLTRLVFGMASSPFLAIRTLLQVAADGEKEFPLAAQLIRRAFYVDDLLCSFDSLEEALEVLRQLVGILKLGKFVLKKWASNLEAALTNIPKADKLMDINKQLELPDTDVVKILGLQWNLKRDVFHYKVLRTVD